MNRSEQSSCSNDGMRSHPLLRKMCRGGRKRAELDFKVPHQEQQDDALQKRRKQKLKNVVVQKISQ